METFEDFLDAMGEPEQQDKLKEILDWVQEKYPGLEKRVAWSQPMFVDHGTFIIGFSYAKHHIAISPEGKAIKEYVSTIEEKKLSYTNNIIRLKWDDQIPYDLLTELINYNMEDKKDDTKFWR